jgi:hypothetical protein
MQISELFQYKIISCSIIRPLIWETKWINGQHIECNVCTCATCMDMYMGTETYVYLPTFLNLANITLNFCVSGFQWM